MHRRYLESFLAHFRQNRQMLLVSGPRQVGKTTIARQLGECFASKEYFNWDNQTHRGAILDGPEAVAGLLGLDRLLAEKPFCAFDELHKYRGWRDFLKGFLDVHEQLLKPSALFGFIPTFSTDSLQYIGNQRSAVQVQIDLLRHSFSPN